MKKIILPFLILMTINFSTNAQSWGEYTLVALQNATSAKLIDINKTTYKTWICSGNTGYSSYVLPGGTLLRTVKPAAAAAFSGGGMHGRVQKVDWNNVTTWDYTYSTANYCLHHDICALPNGNVLAVAYARKTAAEGTAVGYSSNRELWSESIVELQPNGTTGATVVWQWNLWDHLVQNVNTSLSNYGVINQHPELLNINYNSSGGKDWVHANGIDYNESLNQIVFSSHFLNEIYIIDHSTTTAQAATHSGGTYGKGGDFLYRWGNPAAYGMTGTANFNVLHDAHFVPSNAPNAGQLSAFSNNGASPNSSVDVFNPPASNGVYSFTAGSAYAPTSLTKKITCNGFSSNMGSAQQLPNGNTLICIATAGTIYEVNSAGTSIWTYNAGGSTPQASRYSACYINGIPTATITPSISTVCSGGSATLNLTPGIAGTYTYAWSGSDGFTSSLQNPVVNPTSNTTYTATISSGVGCSNTATASINVGSAPTVSAGANQTITAGQTTTLTASGGTSYSWNNGQTSATISVSPSTTTTYSVTATNASGCAATANVTVSVNTAAITAAASSNPTSICTGASAQIGVAANGGNGTYSYAWTSNPSGFSSSAQYPTVLPTQTTTYQCIVTSGTASTTVSTTLTVNALPTVSAGANQTITAGQTTTLTASGGTSYSWNNGQTSVTISVSPSITTTYSVTATNASGCAATANVTVSVGLAPIVATITATKNSVCVGDTTTLSISASGGNGVYSYAWTSVPTGFVSNLPNPKVVPNVNTSYNVLVTSGNINTNSNISITINILPNVNAGKDTSIYLGQVAPLLAIGGVSYAWSNGVLAALNPVSPSVTTTYSVTATDANGCKNNDNVIVNLLGVPLSAVVSASKSTICKNDSTQLLTSISGGSATTTYAWTSVPVGFSSTLKNPTVAPNLNTTYNLVVQNGTSSATSTVSIVVNALPVANAGTDVSVLKGKSTTLQATGGTGYAWSNAVVTAINTVAPIATTTYIVTVSNANGCTATDAVIVTVLQPIITTIAAAGKALCKGENITLTAVASGGNGLLNYAWSSNPVGFTSNIATISATPNVNTTFTVIINDGKISDTSSVVIKVNPLPVAPSIMVLKDSLVSSAATGNQWFLNGVLIPNVSSQTYKPTQNGNYQVKTIDINGCESALSEIKIVSNIVANSDIEFSTFVISPNPSQGVFMISHSENKDFEVCVLNAFGQQILKDSISTLIDLQSFPNGVYYAILKIKESKMVLVKKLILVD